MTGVGLDDRVRVKVCVERAVIKDGVELDGPTGTKVVEVMVTVLTSTEVDCGRELEDSWLEEEARLEDSELKLD
jgi:hypothetical protein